MDILEREARESVRVWLLYRWQDCFEVLPDGCVVQKVSNEKMAKMIQEDLLP